MLPMLHIESFPANISTDSSDLGLVELAFGTSRTADWKLVLKASLIFHEL